MKELVLIVLGMVLGLQVLASNKDSLYIREFEDAAIHEQLVLLVFSGSDWCRNCIRLEREIFQTPRFQKFINNRLILLKADFPQRKKLNTTVQKRNDWLAGRYNPSGDFPKLLLLDSRQQVLAEIEHLNANADFFIRYLNDKIKEYTHKEFTSQTKLMGSRFEFSLIDSKNSLRADSLLILGMEEVSRIEGLISEWSDTTQLSRINQSAGKSPVCVDRELYELIRRSVRMSELTQGAFDISIQALLDIWKFDQQETVLPEHGKLDDALKNVGYAQIRLQEPDLVYLERESMGIGFGGIGKGYAADRVKAMWIDLGIEDGVVNAGGDLIAWGKPPDAMYWKIAIADPRDPGTIIGWLPINNAAVATSGSYEKYLLIDGQRYSHIIDPKSGYPARGVLSVSVISPSAELSDALATAVFVLGKEVGLDLINQLDNTECLIIDEDFKIHFSRKLKLLEPDEN